MSLEKRLNYLKEVSAFVRITEEPRHVGEDMYNIYRLIEDNILTHYNVTQRDLNRDYKVRHFQYTGLMEEQLNMDLGYQEDRIIGEIK